MKGGFIVIVGIIALMSIAAGLAKVIQAPQEMEFLQGAGLSTAMIVTFGLVQVLGGVLLIPGRTRLSGVVLAALAFLVSAILIYSNGDLAFGLVSLLPVGLSCVVIYQCEDSK